MLFYSYLQLQEEKEKLYSENKWVLLSIVAWWLTRGSLGPSLSIQSQALNLFSLKEC